MPEINVRDTNLYYEEIGNGEVPLLFVHGMCGGAWSWEDQMRRLSGNFRCIAYDRRGHSRSESGNEVLSDQTHTDDAAALIDALELDRPIVVGSSSGAVIGANLLHRYKGVARGAVLSEPPLFSIDPDAGKELIEAVGPLVEEAVARGDIRAAVDAFFEVVCGHFWPRLEEAGKNQYRDNSAMLLATLKGEAVSIGLSDLNAIQTPSLVISGSESLPSFRSIARLLADNLIDARFLEFERAGHVSYAECPVAFACAVSSFVCEVNG